MHKLERRVEKLEHNEGVGIRPCLQVIIDDGDDLDAAAEAAGYDPEQHFLIVRKIVEPECAQDLQT